MRKAYFLIIAAAVSGIFTSCIKDEAPNAECDIERAYIHADVPEDIFLKATDSIGLVNEDAKTVNFIVRKGTDLTAIAPIFHVTPGATTYPANGSMQDFSHGAVSYTVTSEDGQWHKTYRVSVNEKEDMSPHFNFETFFLEPTKSKYYVWSDLNSNGEYMNNWASGNGGYSIVAQRATPDKYPTTPLTDGYEGHGVKMETKSTGMAGLMFGMPIAAGNLFTGSFDTETAKDNALLSTHFGEGPYCVISAKPVKFTGWYQYTPGAEYKNLQQELVPGKTDQADMYAVIFRNTTTDANGKETPFYLNGNNVKTSEQIIAIASAGPADKTENGWKYFNVPFVYTSEFDPHTLETGGYSMAIVFTSSVEGAHFEGAVGSTLLIDKVTVVME